MKISESSDIDSANRRAMGSAEAVAHYAKMNYLDPGEEALYREIAPEAKGKPILDLGVGGGRTTPALTAISTRYIGVDYTPAMVDGLRIRFPDLRFEVADARALSMFEAGSFFLVVFSCAGIDMVNAADRVKILAEVKRILVPGGAFIFSTHNLELRSREGEPTVWRVLFPVQLCANPIKLAVRFAKAARGAFERLRNFRALRALAERHDNWAILNSYYHQYSTLMHYTTLEAQQEALEKAGFSPGALAFSNAGERLSRNGSQTLMLHLMARTPLRS